MSTESSSKKSYVYVGLAGETALGRPIQSGLYRMADGDDGWESLTNGLPESPEIRAIAIHPRRPEVMYVGTQAGPYRSADHGDHWEKVGVPDHGTAVWSLLFHPRDANVMYAGYESCEIFRSDDGGERWSQLPVNVRFPEVTTGPGANLAKRVLMMAGSAADPNVLYGAIEVGGIIRTLDGGEHWENLTLQRFSPIYYSRGVRMDPNQGQTVYACVGSDFRGDKGGILRSSDLGDTWERFDHGHSVDSTTFGLSVNPQDSGQVYFCTRRGQVFGTDDGGTTWHDHPLPGDVIDSISVLAASAS
jgi:photosystem II stability/assembly factor-like uncharacterized protein